MQQYYCGITMPSTSRERPSVTLRIVPVSPTPAGRGGAWSAWFRLVWPGLWSSYTFRYISPVNLSCPNGVVTPAHPSCIASTAVWTPFPYWPVKSQISFFRELCALTARGILLRPCCASPCLVVLLRIIRLLNSFRTVLPFRRQITWS